jgi:CRP/FNR family transcriptional regulator
MKHPSLLSEREHQVQDGIGQPSTAPRDSNGRAVRRDIRRTAPGSILFLEGDECQGVLIVRKGRVKLSVEHSAGRALTVAIVGAGDMIGIAACFGGKAHETTAEALETCEAEYITRGEFLNRIENDQEFALETIRQLSADNLGICQTLTSLSGTDPVIVRLARLFAGWAPERNGHKSLCLKNRFTHQQMAEMIGTTRETITRSLTEMRNSEVATLRNGELLIHDHERLLLLAANGTKPL